MISRLDNFNRTLTVVWQSFCSHFQRTAWGQWVWLVKKNRRKYKLNRKPAAKADQWGQVNWKWNWALCIVFLLLQALKAVGNVLYVLRYRTFHVTYLAQGHLDGVRHLSHRYPTHITWNCRTFPMVLIATVVSTMNGSQNNWRWSYIYQN